MKLSLTRKNIEIHPGHHEETWFLDEIGSSLNIFTHELVKTSSNICNGTKQECLTRCAEIEALGIPLTFQA